MPQTPPLGRPSCDPRRPQGWTWGALSCFLALSACVPGTSEPQASPRTESQPASQDWTTGEDGVERDQYGIPRSAPISPSARREIGEFVESMIPPPLEATSDLHDQWLFRTRALRRELEGRQEEIGNAALHAFTGNVTDRSVTRGALLTIGARCSPQAAAPILRELMMTYGYRYDDRTTASVLLAEVDPLSFMEAAKDHLRRRERATETMPPDEFLLRGWVTACERSGQSPVDMLADVSTSLIIDPPARYAAAEFLGHYPNHPLGREALKTCLVESTGDAYLRRKAAQAIKASFNAEEACSLFTFVLSREVDPVFASFLNDMVELLGCR